MDRRSGGDRVAEPGRGDQRHAPAQAVTRGADRRSGHLRPRQQETPVGAGIGDDRLVRERGAVREQPRASRPIWGLDLEPALMGMLSTANEWRIGGNANGCGVWPSDAIVAGANAMTGWPANPVIYEVNTAVWLASLSQAAGRWLTLAEVAPSGWET